VELLASGRTAEVFVWAAGRVLKLDRLEWNGLSEMEAAALAMVAEAGVRAPRAYELVEVGDRRGLVMDRIEGPILADVISRASDLESLAVLWTEMQTSLHARTVEGLPNLVDGLANAILASGLAPSLVAELLGRLDDLDDGRRALCHFDLHPGNVIVSRTGWVVIDWTTASAGPPDADFARTLVLDPPGARSSRERFMSAVRRLGIRARGGDPSRVDAWIRVIAAARLAEGFEGAHADNLAALARGARRPDG